MTQILSFTFAIGLAQLFSALSLYLYTNQLTPEEYSIVAVSESFVLLFQVVIALSLEKAVQRFSLEYKTSELAFASTVIATAIAIVVSLLFFLFGLLLPIENYTGVNIHQLMMLIFTAYGYALSGFSLSKYQFDVNPLCYFLVSFLRNFTFFTSSYFFLVNGLNIDSFYLAGFVSSIIICTFIVFKLDVKVYIKDISFYLSLLVYSIPFAASAFCSWLLTWSNRIFFAKTQSPEFLGLLSASQKYAMIFFLFTQGVALVATPKILQALNDNDNDRYVNHVNKFTNILTILGLSAMILLPFILSIFLEAEYLQSITYLPLFIAVYLFSIVTSLSMANYIVYLKKSVQQMKMTICCSLLAIGFYLSIDQALSLFSLTCFILIPVLLLDLLHILYVKFILKLKFPYFRIFSPSASVLTFTAIYTFIISGAV